MNIATIYLQRKREDVRKGEKVQKGRRGGLGTPYDTEARGGRSYHSYQCRSENYAAESGAGLERGCSRAGAGLERGWSWAGVGLLDPCSYCRSGSI